MWHQKRREYTWWQPSGQNLGNKTAWPHGTRDPATIIFITLHTYKSVAIEWFCFIPIISKVMHCQQFDIPIFVSNVHCYEVSHLLVFIVNRLPQFDSSRVKYSSVSCNVSAASGVQPTFPFNGYWCLFPQSKTAGV
jgi:hypothetical protein